MKASIIMPAYNVERFIGYNLESIKNQDFPLNELEIIIVNDGSTDKTEEVITRYIRENGVDIKYSKQNNLGISAARNKAMSIASGDVLFFVDADDFIHPSCIRKCVEALDRHPQIGLVYSDHAKINEEGEIIDYELKPDWNFKHFSTFRYNFVGHIKAARTNAVKGILFDPDCPYAEDFDWLLRVAESGVEFLHLPKVLYYWRRYPESISFRTTKEVRNNLTKKVKEESKRRRKTGSWTTKQKTKSDY